MGLRDVLDFDELFYCPSQHLVDLGTSFVNYTDFLSSVKGLFPFRYQERKILPVHPEGDHGGQPKFSGSSF